MSKKAGPPGVVFSDGWIEVTRGGKVTRLVRDSVEGVTLESLVNNAGQMVLDSLIDWAGEHKTPVPPLQGEEEQRQWLSDQKKAWVRGLLQKLNSNMQTLTGGRIRVVDSDEGVGIDIPDELKPGCVVLAGLVTLDRSILNAESMAVLKNFFELCQLDIVIEWSGGSGLELSGTDFPKLKPLMPPEVE